MCANDVPPGPVAVRGTGRTAAVVVAGLARLGHEVVCSPEVLHRADLSAEPGLGSALLDPLRSGRLRCSGAPRARTVFVCGDRAGIARLSERLPDGGTVVNTCLPPWECTSALAGALGRPDLRFASHPLVLRPGTALQDFLAPDCLVIGSTDPAAGRVVADLHPAASAPVVHVDLRTADLVGPARDGLCAMKQQFFDQLADYCQAVGADVDSVVACLQGDRRIGRPRTRAATDQLDVDQHRGVARLRALAGADAPPPTLSALDAHP
ncbi:UDP-glucose 6-dehydrogenase [Saccharopolyspora sp. NPDC000359]|uniref:UDP-glucose 6-dehydrogenase n=1 Tax=Saccharopolyspora sp. NPDC000359 TaxID=3154251 RepID=UPI00332E2015